MDIGRGSVKHLGHTDQKFCMEEHHMSFRCTEAFGVKQWDPIYQQSISRGMQRMGVQQSFSFVELPKTNRQAKAANKVILRAIRRKVSSFKGDWPESLPGILLSYHTMPQTTTRESLL